MRTSGITSTRNKTKAERVEFNRAAAAPFRAITEETRRRWYALAEFCRREPGFLTHLETTRPDLHDKLCSGFRVLAIQHRDMAWTAPGGARPAQLLPGTEGSFSDKADWLVWLLMGGRGSGKSRTGGEGTKSLLWERDWGCEHVRGAFVGRTLAAVRTEMFENTFLQIIPDEHIISWRRNICELMLWLPSETIATINGYSAEAPDALRGPNFHLAWCDELASWPDADRGSAVADTAWTNLLPAVRAGDVSQTDRSEWHPRIIVTTTPKAVKLLRNPTPTDAADPGVGIVDQATTVTSSMSTLENLENLAPSFYNSAIAPFEGTRLYRQEVLGELIEETVGAGWSFELISAMRRRPSDVDHQGGGLETVVIGVDPATVDDPSNAEHGIVVAGRSVDGRAWILQDGSMRGRPSDVCNRIAELAEMWGASSVVVEVNNGGSWVTTTLAQAFPNLPVKSVWAKRNKIVRSEPVTLMSDQRRVLLAGEFPLLERQMMTFAGEGPSPDRLDAMVYAVLFLMPAGSRVGELLSVVSGPQIVR